MIAARRVARSACALLPLLLFTHSAIASSPPTKTLDGDFDDWRPGESIAADDHYVYLRLDLGRDLSLQGSEALTVVAFDLDDRVDTGVSWPDALAAALLTEDAAPDKADLGEALGAELIVILSPRNIEHPEWTRGGGARVVGVGEDGMVDIRHFDVGLAFQPTHASDVYEMRISRHAALPSSLDGSLRAGGSVRARFARLTSGGEVLAASEALRVGLETAASERWRGDAPMPPRPEGGVRVLSWNVLWGAPMQSPERFARTLRAIDADVVLFQEWDLYDRGAPLITPEQTEAWLNEVTPLEGGGRWEAVRSDARGITIASRHPIANLTPERIVAEVEGEGRADESEQEEEPREPRVVFASIETPAGPLLAASLHLKCCGSLGTREDVTRMAEAAAVNAAMRSLIESEGARGVLIGGDVNLVGSPAPLAVLRSGLDPVGGDLALADVEPLAGYATLTWKQPDSSYTPAQLDYFLFSASSLRVVNAFILDEDVLTDEALRAMGLSRGDTHGTDHLPVVVDLVGRSAR